MPRPGEPLYLILATFWQLLSRNPPCSTSPRFFLFCWWPSPGSSTMSTSSLVFIRQHLRRPKLLVNNNYLASVPNSIAVPCRATIASTSLPIIASIATILTKTSTSLNFRTLWAIFWHETNLAWFRQSDLSPSHRSILILCSPTPSFNTAHHTASIISKPVKHPCPTRLQYAHNQQPQHWNCGDYNHGIRLEDFGCLEVNERNKMHRIWTHDSHLQLLRK